MDGERNETLTKARVHAIIIDKLCGSQYLLTDALATLEKVSPLKSRYLPIVVITVVEK